MLSFLVLYSNSIGVKLEEETLVPRVGPRTTCHNSRRFATRVVQHAPLSYLTLLLSQSIPVVVQCTSHSRELGKRRSWSSGKSCGFGSLHQSSRFITSYPRRVLEPCEHRAGEGEADCSGSVACSGVVLGRENSSPWVLGVFVETHKGAESILINFPKAIKPQNPDYCSPTSPTSQLSIRS